MGIKQIQENRNRWEFTLSWQAVQQVATPAYLAYNAIFMHLFFYYVCIKKKPVLKLRALIIVAVNNAQFILKVWTESSQVTKPVDLLKRYEIITVTRPLF